MTRSRFAHFVLPLLLAVLVVALPASAEWKEKVLYSFQGGTTDGSLPAGGVVFDKAGNLYGADTSGGSGGCPNQGCGMVFKISPPAQKGGACTETSIYAFRGVINGASDGFTPAGGLIIDEQGNLYGTTAYGGNGPCVLLGTKAGCGIVYELSPPTQDSGQWTYTILYNFQGGNDGYVPAGNLVLDNKGNLYGATQFGGGSGTTCNIIYGGQCGTVFRLSPPNHRGGKWTEKVLHAFADGTDGAYPNGGLVLDSKGAIYGTTFGGGKENSECGSLGCGTVFELVPPSREGGVWSEKILYRFSGQDGANPAASVVLGVDGDLYGTAYAGANSGYGAVFELARLDDGTSEHWKEIVLYRFMDGSDGENPAAGLTLDAQGNLYGATEYGSAFSGTVFRLRSPKRTAGSWTFGLLHGFMRSPDGADPAATLIFDKHGKLYGTTEAGGATCGCGTVFEIKP